MDKAEMTRSGCHFVSPSVVLLLLLLIGGCAATPLQVVKAEPAVDFRRYTTLVVEDFQNGVGDALPLRVLQELPQAVIAHLNACYPGAFSRIVQTPSGSPEELIVGGTITEYREKIWYDLYDRVKFTSEVTFVDGQSGREFTKITVDPGGMAAIANPIAWSLLAVQAITMMPLGIFAPSLSEKIDILIDKAANQIADTIAETKGLSQRRDTVEAACNES
jgi:hypothetical protein